jgi:class 3 adenylate cyclase/predicted ATPase
MSEIADWLKTLGMSEYAERFAENRVDLGVLPDLTDQDLEKLGVLLGDRRKMLRAIRELGKASAAATVPSTLAATQPARYDGAERRQLTLMFCDLVGSTALSAKLDPEDLRGIIGAYHRCCTELVERNGGFVARYMGDGVLAYFGYPQAHEHDAERAVRAGLALVEAVPKLVTAPGSPLQARVGIATGLVVVGDLIGSGEAQERGVVGETPNLAARLQAIAEPNTVVIADSTRRLLGNLFELEDLGPRDLKGIAGPTRAWAALRPSSVASRFEAMHATSLTALVGREEEFELLLRRWSKAKSGEGQVVLLSGEAGIGKSRLTASLLERLANEPHTRLLYSCSPQYTDSALHPIIGQMERAAGLAHGDEPQVRLDKLDALLALSSTPTQHAALFAEMLSLPNDGRYPALELTPLQRRQRTLEALVSHMEALTLQSPVLTIFEDAHWTDPTSLELFGRAVDRIPTLRVLLIVTFRAEFDPPWIGRPHVTALTINRLARREVGVMIDRVAGNKLLPVSIREDIVERADGIPLFVEEMTKSVLEAESESEARRTVAMVPSPALAVPASLHASLMARLDRLGPAKEVAQIGAAIGREFSHALLAAVVRKPEAELGSALDRLIAAGLLFRHGVPPHASYLFKHALVQDAAYGTLLREPRRALHARIAEALESQFAENAEAAYSTPPGSKRRLLHRPIAYALEEKVPATPQMQPELLAHHLAQGGLTEQAIDYLRKAGQHAIEQSANAEAMGHLTRALDLLQLLPESPERVQLALGLQAMLGQATIAMRGYAAPETIEILLRARSLINDLTDRSEKFAILYGIWAAFYVGGRSAEQQSSAAEFLAEALRHDEAAWLCIAHRTLGTTCLTSGEFATALEHLEQARALYDAQRHSGLRHQYGQDIGAAALCYLSWALWHLGSVDQAAEVADAAMRHAEELSHPHTMVYTICHARGFMNIFRRRPGDLQYWADLVVSMCTEHGFSHWINCGRILQGWAAICRGDIDRGIEVLRAGVTAWRGTRARLWLPIFLTLEAEAYAKTGHGDVALHTIEQALAVSEETGEIWAKAEVLRIKARLLLETRRATTDEIEALLVTSLKIARRQRARCFELRAAFDLARIWQGQKRDDEARSLLRPVYDQFTEGLNTADLQEARILIQNLQ